MICKYCGCMLRDTAKFCNGCGNSTGVTEVISYETGFYEADKTDYESAPVHVTFAPKPKAYEPETIIYSTDMDVRETDGAVYKSETNIYRHEMEEYKPTSDKMDFKPDPVDLGPVRELRKILLGDPYTKSALQYISNYDIPDDCDEIYEFMALIATKIDKNDINSEETDSEVTLSRILFAKFELAYQKANLKYGDSEKMNALKELYDKTVKEKVKKESFFTNFLLMIIIMVMTVAIVLGVIFYTKINNLSNNNDYSVMEESENRVRKKDVKPKESSDDKPVHLDGLPGASSNLPGTGSEKKDGMFE